MTNQSGIKGYVNTNSSITILFHNNEAYRYDLCTQLSKEQLNNMIALAKSGKGLNSFLNANPQIRKLGYIYSILKNGSYNSYG